VRALNELDGRRGEHVVWPLGFAREGKDVAALSLSRDGGRYLGHAEAPCRG
jgi:hypothetical protein